MKKGLILVLLILSLSLVTASTYDYKYNPYSGKQDRSLALNQSGTNFTMDWTGLTNYPVACPTYSAITQLDDSITCTDSWIHRDGDTMTGNLGIKMTPNYELDINGTIRAYSNLIVGNNTGAAGFTGLGDIYALGNLKVMEGIFAEAQQYGAGLEVSDNDLEIIYTNILTANATINTTTQILYDSEANFNSTYLEQSLRVFSSTPSYIGATAEIITVIDSTHLELSFATSGNDVILDTNETSYIVYPAPILFVGDNGVIQMDIGDNSEAQFGIHIHNGTGFTGVYIHDIAGADQHQALTIDMDIKTYNGIVGLNMFRKSSTGADETTSNLILLESDATGINNSDLTFISMNTVGMGGSNNHLDGIRVSPSVEHIIHVGSADTVSSVYDNEVNITANVTDGGTAEVFTDDNDVLYVGSDVNFTTMSFSLDTEGSANAKFLYLYCNGTDYKVLTIGADTTNGFTTSGSLNFPNPSDRGTCNFEKDDTAFSDTTNYSYIALKRRRNIIVTPPVLDTVTVAGATQSMILQKDMMKLNPVDTAPETCDATYLGAQYFDISEDGTCECTSGGWVVMHDHSACT